MGRWLRLQCFKASLVSLMDVQNGDPLSSLTLMVPSPSLLLWPRALSVFGQNSCLIAFSLDVLLYGSFFPSHFPAWLLLVSQADLR